ELWILEAECAEHSASSRGYRRGPRASPWRHSSFQNSSRDSADHFFDRNLCGCRFGIVIAVPLRIYIVAIGLACCVPSLTAQQQESATVSSRQVPAADPSHSTYEEQLRRLSDEGDRANSIHGPSKPAGSSSSSSSYRDDLKTSLAGDDTKEVPETDA